MNAPRPRRRRPYAPPRLVDHGPIPARALSVTAAGSIFDAVKSAARKKA